MKTETAGFSTIVTVIGLVISAPLSCSYVWLLDSCNTGSAADTRRKLRCWNVSRNPVMNFILNRNFKQQWQLILTVLSCSEY